jgi:hypothetical protein
MAGEDRVLMSAREIKRLHVIGKYHEGLIDQVEGAEILRVSLRQFRRMQKRVLAEGPAGVVNRHRGRRSNRALEEQTRMLALEAYQRKYYDFGPTLAAEKLLEYEGIKVSKETYRKWLIEAEIWHKEKKRAKRRQYRQRKSCFGLMVQIDGSKHAWFEDRRAECVLMAYIDDATNHVYARFYEYEGTMPAMDSFMRYARKYGLPCSVYLDRHTTYKSPKKQDDVFDENGNMLDALSQFARALKELEVEVIHAYSPQAKGRVERLFGTLQDRLVKEMRLKGISGIEEANLYLAEYLKRHNDQFSVIAAESEDMHRPSPKVSELQEKLCVKEERTVRNDNTISYNGKPYQIHATLQGKKVCVQQRIDGRMYILHNSVSLNFSQITARVEKKQKPLRLIKTRPSIPMSADHPYRKKKDLLFKRDQLKKQFKQSASLTLS